MYHDHGISGRDIKIVDLLYDNSVSIVMVRRDILLNSGLRSRTKKDQLVFAKQSAN